MSASSMEGDRIAGLVAENDELRSQLDSVRNRSLDTWLGVVHDSGVAVRDFETSLSWRVTRPLRLLRRIQVAIRDAGLRGAVSAGVRRLRSRLRAQ